MNDVVYVLRDALLAYLFEEGLITYKQQRKIGRLIFRGKNRRERIREIFKKASKAVIKNRKMFISVDHSNFINTH